MVAFEKFWVEPLIFPCEVMEDLLHAYSFQGIAQVLYLDQTISFKPINPSNTLFSPDIKQALLCKTQL